MRFVWIYFISLVLCIPFCNSMEIIYHIKEETPANTFIGNFARDAKLDPSFANQQANTLKYSSLKEGNKLADLFNVDPATGEISTTKKIDREEVCKFKASCEVNLEVTAQSTRNAFFTVIKVKIYVDDINDNLPLFNVDTLQLNVSESVKIGTSFLINGARDYDTGQNTLESYDLVPSSSPFTLDVKHNLDGSSVVKLMVSKELDREKVNFYELVVVAKDGGSPPKTGTMTVNVHVVDENDNSPVFSNTTYTVHVEEDIWLQTVILRVNATDADIGKNGRVKYSIASRQPDIIYTSFSLNETTGALSVINYLDTSKDYRFVVQAIDLGDQPLASQAIVVVHVKDTNNNPPIINVNLLSNKDFAEVSEFANVGTVVAYIRVRDEDTGDNGQITCSIASKTFELQEYVKHQFMVTVKVSLDREATPGYTVRVQCEDGGGQASMVTFDVIVKDENDHVPTFQPNIYVVNMDENNSIGQFLLRVSATDSDIGENKRVTYSLPQNITKFVRIDGRNGVLKANAVFDRENMSQIMFSVTARDNGKPPLSSEALVVINIDDVNDCPPTFNESSFVYRIPENQPAGAYVGSISVVDRDSGKNGRFMVAMLEDADAVPFIVLPDGSIKTQEVLDREMREQYQFTITAIDLGDTPLRSSAEVMIQVLDENDNKPVFIFPNATNNSVSIPKSAKPSTVVTRIVSYDLDKGINAEQRFTFRNNATSLLSINPITGEIFLMDKITDKTMGIFKFEILISDNGIPSHSATAVLHVGLGVQIVQGSLLDDENTKLTIIIVCVTIAVIIIIAAILTFIIIIRKYGKNKLGHNYHVRSSENANCEFSRDPPSFGFNVVGKDKPKKNPLLPQNNAPRKSPLPVVDDREGYESNRLLEANSRPNPVLETFVNRNNRMTPSNSHDVLRYSSSSSEGDGPADIKPDLITERGKVQDSDIPSSRSSRETITNDSGRGGSDEDEWKGHHERTDRDSINGRTNSLSKKKVTFCDKKQYPQSTYLIYKEEFEPYARGNTGGFSTFKDDHHSDSANNLSTFSSFGRSSTPNSDRSTPNNELNSSFGSSKNLEDDETTTSGSYCMDDDEEKIVRKSPHTLL